MKPGQSEAARILAHEVNKFADRFQVEASMTRENGHPFFLTADNVSLLFGFAARAFTLYRLQQSQPREPRRQEPFNEGNAIK